MVNPVSTADPMAAMAILAGTAILVGMVDLMAGTAVLVAAFKEKVTAAPPVVMAVREDMVTDTIPSPANHQRRDRRDQKGVDENAREHGRAGIVR